MTSLRLLTVLALAPALAAAQPAARPAADTTPVPRDLVMALLGPHLDGEGGRIVVGRVPAGFPMDVIPPDAARILGGVERRAVGMGRGGRADSVVGGTVVLAVPRTAPDAGAWLADHAQRVGFKPPPMHMGPSELGGFVDDDTRSRSFSMLCRGKQMLMNIGSDGAGGQRTVAVTLNEVPEPYSPCNMAGMAGVAGSVSGVVVGRGGVDLSMGDSPGHSSMPKLRLPPGVGSHGVSTDMGGQALQSSVRVDASGPPGDLVAHFARQLRDAGWTLGAATSTTMLAVQTAQKRETGGRELFAVLTAAVVPGTTERDLVFRMMWSASPQR